MYNILHLETSMLYKTLIREISAEISAVYFGTSAIDEAVDIIKREQISLIITAMELEGGSSIDFIKSLNESEYKHIPVVVFTGNDSLEDRKRMYELGIIDYIIKTTPKDVVKQNLITYRKSDTVIEVMRSLHYAVLDDNKMDRKIIGRIFSMHNIRNVDFFDTENKLLASEKKYDVYLIDLVLKDTSGDKVIIKLKDKDSGSVVIAVSGIDNIKIISRVLSIGADDYITKPFNYDLFMARLSTNIRSYLLLQEVKNKTEQLEKMAVTDYLTGLNNRRHIFDRLSQEIEKYTRYQSKFSLAMFDIDHFKKINDTYGHQTGDSVLIKVAEAIQSSIRNVDIAGRYGGEEFILILPEIALNGAVKVAERIRIRISEIKNENDSFTFTVSGGVAEFHGEDIHEFVKKIDKLLYAAKDGGRNRISY